MIIAATDYDGTLCQQRMVSPDVLKSIYDWRKAGNVFGIVTGRDLSMIRYEIERWGLPFDFLVCCNGAAGYNASFELLFSINVPDSCVREILDHPAAVSSLHFELAAAGVTYLYLQSEDSWFPALGTPYIELNRARAMRLTGLQQISLAYKSPQEAVAWASALNMDFGQYVIAYQNKGCVDITQKEVSKTGGIENIRKMNKWFDSGILVIGDADNDLPMIWRFSGFCVSNAADNIKRAAKAVFADVGEMLRANM